jgi:O-antigen ligase
MRKLAFAMTILMVFAIPWEDAITIGGVSSVTRYIGIIAFFTWFVSVLLRGKLRRFHFYHVMVIIFVIWNIASLLWTPALDYTVQQIITYIQLIGLSLIIWDLITTPDRLYAALQAYVLGAYISIGSTIVDYIRGQEIKLYSGGRYAGIGNAGELALILTLGLPIAWHLATAPEYRNINKLWRLINFIYIPAAVFAILLTGTRTAIFAVIPVCIYIFATIARLRPAYRVSAVIIIILALFILQPLIPRSTVERLGTVFYSITEGDLGGRVSIWRESINFFVDHPFIGIGSGALYSPFVLGYVAHNTFLSILVELGVIGFTLFSGILIIITVQAFHQNAINAKLWITMMSVWAIGVFTLTWEYRKVTWLLFALILVNAKMAKRNPVQKESVNNTIGLPYQQTIKNL